MRMLQIQMFFLPIIILSLLLVIFSTIGVQGLSNNIEDSITGFFTKEKKPAYIENELIINEEIISSENPINSISPENPVEPLSSEVLQPNYEGIMIANVTTNITPKMLISKENETILISNGFSTTEPMILSYTTNQTARVIISLNVDTFASHAKRILSEDSIQVSDIQVERQAFALAKEEVTSAISDIAVTGDLKLINAISAEVPLEKLAELKEMPAVKNVWSDKEVHILINDSIPMIDANDVWNMTDFLGGSVNGSGIEIVIIDTGIDVNHPDLNDLDDNSSTNDPKVVRFKNFISTNQVPKDDNGHGTHCASTAAGTGNASGGKFKGVAPGAKLWGAKVLDSSGSGYFSDVIEGIEWATDPNGDGNYSDRADVISMSLGANDNGDGTDPMALALDAAVDRGVVVAQAAGNMGPSYYSIGVPGDSKKAITVGAGTKTGGMAVFSSRGPTTDLRIKPDIIAPGDHICAANASNGIFLGGEDCGNSRYQKLSGTSMATPHVAGAAALLLQAHQNWTPDIIKSAFMNTANTDGWPIFSWDRGAGKLNVLNATITSAIITPGSLSLGLVNLSEGLWNTTQVLIIKNMVNYTVEYNFSYTKTSTSNVVITFNATNLSLAPGQEIALEVNFTVNTSNTSFGLHGGELNFNSPSGRLHIPFGFVKSIVVRATFSENPWVVMICSRTADWCVGDTYPGTSATFFVDTLGDYDMRTIFIGYGAFDYPLISIVMRENFSLSGIVNMAINKSEATNILKPEPKDQLNNTLTGYKMHDTMFFKSKVSSIWFMISTLVGHVMISNVTDYNVSWITQLRPQGQYSQLMYRTIGTSDSGIHADTNLTNSPDMKHIVYFYDFPTSSVTLQHWECILSGGAYWSCISKGTDGKTLTSSSAIEDAWYSPMPFPSFMIMPKVTMSGYDAPIFRIINNKTIIMDYIFYRDITQINDTVIKLGTEPQMWAGKMYSTDSTFRLYSSDYHFFFFITQNNMGGHGSFKFELYNAAGIVYNQSIPQGSSGIDAPIVPGWHFLKVNRSYWHDGQLVMAQIFSEFNTSKSDGAPPMFDSKDPLKLFVNGKEREIVEPGATVTVDFNMSDWGSPFTVNLSFREDNELWQQANLTYVDGRWKANITSSANNVSLNITATDDDGNYITDLMQPAFLLRSTHNISAISFEYPDQFITWNESNISTMFFNGGTEKETIIVDLIIDGVAIANKTVEIEQEDVQYVIFNWTPLTSGPYTITVYARPLPGEVNTADNIKTVSTTVFAYAPDIRGIIIPPSGVYGENENISTRIYNLGVVDATDVWAAMYDIQPNGRQINLTNVSIGFLAANSHTDVEYMWRPVIGTHTLKLIVNSTNDSYPYNNEYVIQVDVSYDIIPSGGGGGGGTESDVYILNLSKPQTRTLLTEDSVSFTVLGESHSAKIISISSDSVTLELNSTPFNVTVYVNETKNVDVNRNGYDDLSILLEKIYFDEAYITFSAIAEPTIKPATPIAPVEKPPVPEIIEPPPFTPERKQELFRSVPIIVAFAAMAVTGIWMYTRMVQELKKV